MSEEETNTNETAPKNNPGAEDVKAEEVTAETKESEASDKAKENPAKEGNNGTPETEEEKKAKQTREQDAMFAAKRREAEEAKAKKEAKEKEDKIRNEAFTNGKLDVLKTNPYTEKPIKDSYDLKIYEAQKKLDEEGKDPNKDLPEYLAEEQRQSELKAKQEEEAKSKADKETQAKVDAELAELEKNHPDVKPDELAKDEGFQKFANGKFGRWTLNEIYEAYEAKAGKTAEEKAKSEEDAKKLGSAPSSKGDGNKPPKTTKEMSDKEFIEYRQEHYGN